MSNRQQMRFSTIAPATPTTTTSVELIDNLQGKRGSTSDSIAQLATSQSANKLIAVTAGDDNKDDPRQKCPPASQTNENHHSSPSSPPHLNGVSSIVFEQRQDNNTSSNGVAGDANQRQITTIDPDKECRTGEIYSGDGIQQAQHHQQHDGNV